MCIRDRAASTDHQKEIRFEEDQAPEKGHDPDNPDLSISLVTPDCLQLELLSKSVTAAAERQLEVVRGPAASNTWSEDVEKNNLLCLLDSRRRTKMDHDNWQVARHIQDNMALVKDAELDDLENVQVSVKVSRFC